MDARDLGDDRYAIPPDKMNADRFVTDAATSRDVVARDYPPASEGPERAIGMRPWWRPDRRFATRFPGDLGLSVALMGGPFATIQEAQANLDILSGGMIVTADLNTGDEVPATQT